MRKKILIIEPNSSSGIFLLRAAKENNMEVHGVTHKELFEENYSDEIKKLLDYTIFTDFRTSEVCVEEIAQYGKLNNIDAVVAGFEFVSDIAILVSRKLGLPTHATENVNCLRDKYLMFQIFEKLNVPVAYTEKVSSWEEYLNAVKKFSFPFIVKPVSNAGSCGVAKINSNLDLKNAFQNIKSLGNEFPHGIPLSSDIIIQEFLDGPEYSVECVISHGIVSILGITTKFTTDNNSFAEVGHVFPSELPETNRTEIIDITKKAIKALSLKNGVAHVEVRLTSKGAKVIEIGARLAGDYIPDLILKSVGINCANLYINCALGLDLVIKETKKKCSGIVFLHSKKEGYYKGIKNTLTIDEDIEMEIYLEVGDKVKIAVDNIDRIGEIIITKDSIEDVLSTIYNLKENLKLELISYEGDISYENCIH